MKAALLTKPEQLQITDISEPELGPDEVKIRVEITGICGSDVEVYHGIYPEMEFPVIMGHETAGVVESVGSEVTKVKPGDRVTVEPSWGCGKCYFCNHYKYFYETSNHCIDPRRLGRSVPGSFAEYFKVPERVVYKLPDNVSFEEAQSNTTLACIVHGFRRASPMLGDRVVILGTGHAGLMALQVAKVYGASKVIVVGRRKEKLDLARSLGADVTINMKEEDAIKRILEETDGVGPELVFEFTGVPDMFKIGVMAVKPTGKIMQFGVPAKPGIFELNAIKLMYKEVELVGTASGRGGYPTALYLLSSGKVNVKPFLTHRFKLDDLEKAIEVMDKKIGDPIRVLVSPK